MSQPKLVLHHLRFSRGNRIIWLMEELGLKYDIVVHYFPSKGAYATSLKAVTPLSKAPALIIDGKTYTESGAIITDLLSKFPSAGTESTPSSNSTFWGYFSESSMMLFIQPARFIGLGRHELKSDPALQSEDAQKGTAAMDKWLQGWSHRHAQLALDEAEKFLQHNKWFSGNDKLGVGDFMMWYSIGAVTKTHKLGPGVQGWIDRVRARPAFQAAEKRMKAEEKAQMPQKGKL